MVETNWHVPLKPTIDPHVKLTGTEKEPGIDTTIDVGTMKLEGVTFIVKDVGEANVLGENV